MLYLGLTTQGRRILIFVGSLSVHVGKRCLKKKPMKKSLLALGTIVFLAIIVLIARKHQTKPPIALAQPAKIAVGKGEYMRPQRTNSVPAQNGPVEIHSKVRVTQ